MVTFLNDEDELNMNHIILYKNVYNSLFYILFCDIQKRLRKTVIVYKKFHIITLQNIVVQKHLLQFGMQLAQNSSTLFRFATMWMNSWERLLLK